VIDIAELGAHLPHDKTRLLDAMIEDGMRTSEQYLRGVAASFDGLAVTCTLDIGRAEEPVLVARVG
jgi:hypothetical protein